MLERARAFGIPCAALIGAREHAVRQIEAGVDLLIAQGGGAGGHCREVSTLVLIPEVMRGQRPPSGDGPGSGWDHDRAADGGLHGDGRVRRVDRLGLACDRRGGNVTGVSRENGGGAVARHDPLARANREAGPPAPLRLDQCLGSPRQSWAAANAVAGILSEAAMRRVTQAAEGGNQQARALVSYFVGQGVGLVEGVRSVRSVVQDFMTEFAEALEDPRALAE
jgi:NAD(P)H-dependent flavin oxidoreductase YrpB (nitropropane dioxygenase family)